VLGSVGLQKFGNPYGGTLLERSSVWIFWDQATDFEHGEDAYVHQFRFNIGYVSAPGREIGMSFSVPTSDSLGTTGLTPVGGAGVMPVGDNYVGPYFTRELANGTRVGGTIGYTDAGEGGVALGADVGIPVGERTNVVLTSKYAESESYTLAVGLEMGFGRADTRAY
jgi:hypothetical protein